MGAVMEPLVNWLPTAGVALVWLLVLVVLNRVLERGAVATSGNRFRNQLLMLVLTLAGVVLVILTLPVGDAMRGQILSLVGIVISAAIALSSATMVGNAMAGIMMRVIRGFRIGDFVRVNDHFGRVTELGLFHTEIQTQDRDLTTIPNLYLVTHPLTTVRSSGTIVSTTVSLGYDVPRSTVERLLLEAAAASDLEEPFVQVLELGDFSVTYRIAGLLEDVSLLLTVGSRLRGAVMDTLHGGGVEIVSPNFMNQRVLDAKAAVIPSGPEPSHPTHPETAVEKVIFDKADEAASLEALRDRYREAGAEAEELRAALKAGEMEDDARHGAERRLEGLDALQARLTELIAQREAAAAAERETGKG